MSDSSLPRIAMLIIAVVKSSLALSLGLVGALSIVRFRAAIKEPEELAYLFLTIAIGLGFGADQRLTTVAAFLVIAAVIAVRRWTQPVEDRSNMYLTVSTQDPERVNLKQIAGVFQDNCSSLSLKRFDESVDRLEVCYLINFDNADQLEKVRSALRSYGDSVQVSFIDNEGIV